MGSKKKINIEALKKRTVLVFKGSFNSLTPPLLNILFSFVIIKLFRSALWGNFVYHFLFASLFSLVLNWGNKEILLREFSLNPSSISDLWRRGFVSRSLFILPVTGVLFIYFSAQETLFISLWTFLLFLTQSFEVFIAYHKKFTLSIIIEVISNVVLFTAIFLLRDMMNIVLLIEIYFASLLLKTLLYFILFREDIIENFSLTFDISFLKKSFPFFLLGITGMLSSRIDQYCVSLYMSQTILGEFQILKNFLLYAQVGVGFSLLPFIKNIYRLQDSSVEKIAMKMFIAGIILVLPYTVFIYLIIKFLYGFDFTFIAYIYSAFYILPPFYYSVIIYKMFKNNRQGVVIGINLTIILLTVLLNIILIPHFQIAGVLLAGLIAQWVTAGIYFLYNNKNNSLM